MKKYSELTTDEERSEWMAAQALKAAEATAKKEKFALENKHAHGQLMMWTDSERAIPNDLARTSYGAIFLVPGGVFTALLWSWFRPRFVSMAAFATGLNLDDKND